MAPTSCTTRTAQISLEEDLYIRFRVLDGAVVDEEDALDNLLVVKNLSGNKKTLKLIDIRGHWQMTPKAREILKKHTSAENTIARAYVIDSLITRIMMTFFESFAKPGLPQKFFSSEKQAIAWLKEQL